MKKLSILIVIILLSGCAVTTTVTTPDGRVYTVVSQRDALVDWQDNRNRLVVDNRGRESRFEQTLNALMSGGPDLIEDVLYYLSMEKYSESLAPR